MLAAFVSALGWVWIFVASMVDGQHGLSLIAWLFAVGSLLIAADLQDDD